MNARIKWGIIAGVSIVALGATTAVGAVAWAQYEARQSAPSAAETTTADWARENRIVFRNTAAGQGYGHVASVPLADPSGARAVTDTVCDRVDATPEEFACLRTVRGIAPTYTGAVHTNDGAVRKEWPLPGIPSRTRLSGDGSLIATTSFITGHSYATIGFSTETVIRTVGGESLGNLEEWTLVVGGVPAAPVDRNFWGVTFADDTTFYATVGMSATGTTYLVSGDMITRTLTALAENVECPSLSPDGARIAFKRVTSGSGPTTHWTPAVYDIASGSISLLPEPRSIDDQIEWLDDQTILYGMPREGVPGDTDVWALAADGSTDPDVFIEHAWSPSVVREP
ncbi:MULTISPECIES: hypothetical protein [unclassified Microbacterium]|uniref:hypothetical protein n=1 Tax=unclassified Microbacterium TaxID=2609290 RepID=UPI00214BF94D|nr:MULTISPECIES: hypothetical protein [unclassified Microbacterium]MCR2785011.1 hypothetical protein [Microbacterium sp. zg.B96]WIM16550.1 hypothetical protein QNO11_02600 [Microbacterium sp. zg-B96]